jgi:putative heme-binding domain-containing protein
MSRLIPDAHKIRVKTLMYRSISIAAACFFALVFGAQAQQTNAFELLDGDKVVLIGDTFIEREQSYGYVEYVLTTRFPDRNVTFRNLGWSGDTPAGVSRAGFDTPDKGFDRIKEEITAFKPTVVFLGYGMASSFDGTAGLDRFKTEMNRLMDTIQQIAGERKVRFVLLSPIAHEKLAAPLPDPAKHNEQIAIYYKAIEELSKERGGWFVPLLTLLNNKSFGTPLTDDGIHLTDYGYRRASEALSAGLKWVPQTWRFGITKDDKVRNGSFGTKVIDFKKTENGFRAVTLEDNLVLPRATQAQTNTPFASGDCMMQIVGLKQGNYDLKVDGKAVRTVSSSDIFRGMVLTDGPQWDQADELLETIKKKNELFFHRWRPQNNTYLFLFRKHEQGKNAREIPEFDPLVQAEEEKIAKLRRPVQHTLELVYAEKQGPVMAHASFRKSKPHSTAPITDKPATPFRPQPEPVFQTDPNIEVSLYAENPLLAKPIHMNFDPQGRLWVSSSSVYPQIAPNQEADDKVLVLEDTNGDHKADKVTVFAEGLLIPSAVEPGDGGVYVGQSTELLHFKDTDGDGVADQKRVVLSGFGTEDTHHTLHTLRWGYDGQLYMNQSIYIHSHLETPYGVVRLNSGGTLNLRPSTMELGVFMKGLVNGWGHHYDQYGQSFMTDGAGGEGINYIVPQAMYVTYAGARRILGSVSPGSYPKFASLEMIYSKHFPDDWQGNFITCDFRANRVVRFSKEEQGSAYVTKEMPLFIRTTNVTFRPIDVKMGPDGALYIADWSNPIIQHGEVDFRDPRRDRVHGRIWRVTYKGRPALEAPKLVKASNAELFEQLLSPNSFNKEKARRVLNERGTNILSDLNTWVQKQTTEQARLEGLWMYQGVDVPEPKLLTALLDSKDYHVRAAATRVAGAWNKRLESPLDLLAKRITDEHPRVRMEAARALSLIPTARAAELVLSAVDLPMDRHLDYALWLSINDLAAVWLEAIDSGAWKIEGRQKQLEFGLKAIEPAMATKILAKVLKNIPRDGAGGAIELVGQAGGAAQLRQIFDQVLQGGFEDAAAARALTALSEAARLRNVKPSGDLGPVIKMLDNSNEAVKAAAARLAGSWKLGATTPLLLKLAGDKGTSAGLRKAAFEGLREIGGNSAIQGLRMLAGKEQDDATRRQAAIALAGADLKGSLPQILEVASASGKEDDALAVWRAVLNVKGSAGTVAQALSKTTLSETAAKAGVRVAREGGRNEPDLVLALNKAGSLSDSSQNLTDEEIHAIAYVVTKGDAARGEKLYRRKDLGCMSCHSIGGAGGKVGPDMTSLGASAVTDYIVESVLIPNKKVKEGYHSIQVTTKDGEDLSGILVRENNEELVLRDATNKEISIPKKNIDSRKIGGSLMPSGLADILSPSDRLDLFRFLTELGKAGAYDATKGTVARVWRINPNPSSEQDMLKSNPLDKAWFPVYSTVGGALLKADLEAEQPASSKREPILAAARFQTSKSGPVKLKLSGVNSPKAWVDGKPVGGDSEISMNLPAGTHTFMLKVNIQDMDKQVRLESPDSTFLVE